MKKITGWVMPSLLAAIMLAGILAVIPLSTHAHDGEDHSEDTVVSVESSTQIELMLALIELLQELVEKLQAGASMTTDHSMMDEDKSHDYTELYISVEEHGGVTHIHVYEPGVDEVSFFLEGVAKTDEDAVIAGIVAETGLAEAEVEAAVVFKNDDHHEEEHDEHGDDDEYEGIHIMADGTIMLGNGEVVADATITADGMIELADGTELEPEYDLR